jgi:type I restriction enzyme S subunit
LCKHPGVIIGRKGAYRGVHFSPAPFFVIDTAFYLEPKEGIDIKWAYYELLTQDINGMDSGSAIPSTSRDSFYLLPVNVPPLPAQRAIASILGALDDKIELNRKMNETLEAMARAIYKSWFVDFDPVHAKMAGKKPFDMDEETAALFPNSFEDPAMGNGSTGLTTRIPKGWTWKGLKELTSYLSRGIGPSYIEAGGVLVLNQKCVRDRRVDFSKARRHDTNKKPITGRLIEELDILINSTGVGTLGRIAQVWQTKEDAIVDSHVTIARANKETDPYFLGINLLGREIEIEALGEGSTGQTELSRARLGELPCIVPSTNLQGAFGRIAGSLCKKIANNEEINNSLTNTRDTLLLRLLSGELQVNTLEKSVK